MLPDSALLLDVAPLDAADVPGTNCEEPHTAVFDQVAEVFQTAEGSSDRCTSLVFELNVAIGRHRRSFRDVGAVQCSLDIHVAGADGEDIVLIGVCDPGGWIGGAAGRGKVLYAVSISRALT